MFLQKASDDCVAYR